MLWNILMTLSIWFGWYCMNTILCENLETVDQFLTFVQMGNVIGSIGVNWPDAKGTVFKLFASLDFDVKTRAHVRARTRTKSHCPTTG